MPSFKDWFMTSLFDSIEHMCLSLPPPSEGVTGLKELAFLRDLAEQNSVKYGVDRTSGRDRSSGSGGASVMPVVKGSMMVLNQLSNLETTVGRFYINLPNRMIDLARFSLPYTDPMGDGEWFTAVNGIWNLGRMAKLSSWGLDQFNIIDMNED